MLLHAARATEIRGRRGLDGAGTNQDCRRPHRVHPGRTMRAPLTAGPGARLQRLGRYLRELASLKTEDFEAFVRSAQQSRNLTFTALLETRLREHQWASRVLGRRCEEGDRSRAANGNRKRITSCRAISRNAHRGGRRPPSHSGACCEVRRAAGGLADSRRGRQAAAREPATACLMPV